jgi:hypothetical protein
MGDLRWKVVMVRKTAASRHIFGEDRLDQSAPHSCFLLLGAPDATTEQPAMSTERLSKPVSPPLTPGRDEPPWRRYARTSRVAEFLVAVVLLALALMFSLIDVHDRTRVLH